MTNTEHCTCTCTCCNTVPASCWCGKNRDEATVWEVMLKHTVSAGPLSTSIIRVTAQNMGIDTNEPWTFDFWNGNSEECDDDADVVAVFPFDAVVGVRRV